MLVQLLMCTSDHDIDKPTTTSNDHRRRPLDQDVRVLGMSICHWQSQILCQPCLYRGVYIRYFALPRITSEVIS